MLTERHKEITDKIWEIANRLRGPYRPPQHRLVMLPMVDHHNDNPKPFIWTAKAADILEKVKRARTALHNGQSA